jgi:hypothetical protein
MLQVPSPNDLGPLVPQPRIFISTPHFTPHLIDDSDTEMAQTWRSIEHHGENIELDLCFIGNTPQSSCLQKKDTS